MNRVSEIASLLRLAETGDESVKTDLLPVVYDELRRMAASRLNKEPAALGMGATSLVHEAYMRLADSEGEISFANRRHFFAAAASAMSRILIERARQRSSAKRGGEVRKLDLDLLTLSDPTTIVADVELIALDEAIGELQKRDPQAAELVRLRFFCGCQHQEAAELLGITRRQADGIWIVARTWLYQRLSETAS